jgi:hypothetical protein
VLFPSSAFAFSPELEDTIADVMVWVVVILVPIGALYLFWKAHILPEIVAEKKHHPQKDAIQVLCLLSLAFGGLLWPIAMLWAYVKPVGYKMAYGRDKHDDYYAEQSLMAGESPADVNAEISTEALRERIAAMQTLLKEREQERRPDVGASGDTQ